MPSPSNMYHRLRSHPTDSIALPSASSDWLKRKRAAPGNCSKRPPIQCVETDS